MRKLRAPVVLLAAFALLAGCQDDVLGPDMETVAGTYTATEFRITTTSGAEDILAMGGHITLTLGSDGNTTGSIFVPAFAGDAELSASLDGTWSLSGRTVEFSQDADTFLRDMSFRYTDAGELVGDELFAGGLVEVVLTR